MKRLLVALVAAALAAFLGCEKKSPPGGPGAVSTSTRPMAGATTAPTTHPMPGGEATTGGEKAEEFTIAVPRSSTTLQQGESKNVDVTVNRGSKLKEDVTLEFSTDGKGITITPASHTVKASDANTTVPVTIKAAADAAIGTHAIRVKGTAANGPHTQVTFDVEVKAKK